MKDELDILKEVGSISAAHGSTALSEMIGRKIELNMPTINIIPSHGLTDALKIDGPIISLKTELLTGLSGSIIFMVEEKCAYKFVDICYQSRGEEKPSSLTEMAMSIIKEIGNVVTSAYVNSLGYYLKRLIVPSLPVLINAPFSEIVKLVVNPEDGEDILIVESIFAEKQSMIQGNFWLLLSNEAATDIKSACKKYLEELKNGR